MEMPKNREWLSPGALEALDLLKTHCHKLNSFICSKENKEEIFFILEEFSFIESLVLSDCSKMTFADLCSICKKLGELESLKELSIHKFNIPKYDDSFVVAKRLLNPDIFDNQCLTVDDLFLCLHEGMGEYLRSDQLKTLKLSGDALYPDIKSKRQLHMTPVNLKEEKESELNEIKSRLESEPILNSLEYLILHLSNPIHPYDVLSVISCLVNLKEIEYTNVRPITETEMGQYIKEFVPEGHSCSCVKALNNNLSIRYLPKNGTQVRTIELIYLGTSPKK